MQTAKLRGYITRSRQLQIELPEEFPAGEVEVTIQVPLELYISAEEKPWTEDELQSLLDFQPLPAAQLVTGGWLGQGVPDYEQPTRIAFTSGFAKRS